MSFIFWFLVSFSISLAGLCFYLWRKYQKYKKRYQEVKPVYRPINLPILPIAEVDEIFAPNEFGPTLASQITFIGRGNMYVLGGTSDVEAWILSVLAKKAKNIFEFGTCTGKTTYLMAVNSPEDARIYTLTLPPDQIDSYTQNSVDDEVGTDTAKKESVFTQFMYSGTPVAHKVTQLFMDSKALDENLYADSMDLIFVDGAHTQSYIVSDTQKALRMLKVGGILLWHDYRTDWLCGDVHDVLDAMAKRIDIKLIDDTSIAIYKKDKPQVDFSL